MRVKSTLGLLGLFFFFSCTPKAEKPVVVESLNQNQKAYLQKLLEAGEIPDPQTIFPRKTTPPGAPVNDCEDFKKSLPKDFFQDTLIVPENKNDPQSPLIKVFYYGKIYGQSRPVIFFNGGPGGDSHSSYEVLSGDQSVFNSKKVSFVYIDQRGNGCSEHYPQGADDATLERLKYYGSRQIVEDAEAVREKLIGGKPWKVFGQSYGAFIVHRYVTLYPHSVIAGYAHGGVITSSPYFRFKGRITSQDRVWELYLKTFPQDRRSLEALRDGLVGRRYKDEMSSSTVGGLNSMAGLINILGFVNRWPMIHKWLQVMAPQGQVSDEGMKKYLQILYFSKDPNPANQKRYARHVIDYVDRNVLEAGPDVCRKIYEDLQRNSESSLMTECGPFFKEIEKPETALFEKIHSFVQDLLSMTDFKAALILKPIDFYLYSGDRDPYVPVEVYSEELEAVKDLVHYTNFLETGHDGFHTEAQVWKDLRK